MIQRSSGNSRPLRVLFLCTANSCRSQMAEGLCNAVHAGAILAESAGTNPGVLNRRAVRAMVEIDIDISHNVPRNITDLTSERFDAVITVCDSAHEACLTIPGARRIIHAPFDDPPRLAADSATDEQAMPHYRRVRDQIKTFVQRLPAILATSLQEGDSHMSDRKTPDHTRNCCGDDCCGGTKVPQTNADQTRDTVREGYSKIAEAGTWSATKAASGTATSCCSTSPAKTSGGGCCGPATLSPDDLVRAIGYSNNDLAATPDAANMGLSCGNPTALAALRPGDFVLDLGSGGGFDCFVAGPKVGATGRVIGVDMTPAMLTKARANLTEYSKRTGLSNIEFRLGEIENIPVANSSVDVVISNCVLNLSPDQPKVWNEIARVLKPGGTVAISDLVLIKALPAAIRNDVEALVGCVAGAILVSLIEKMAADAGLTNLCIDRKPGYVDAMIDSHDPLYMRIIKSLPQGEKIGDYVTSANITATKA